MKAELQIDGKAVRNSDHLSMIYIISKTNKKANWK